MAALTPREAFGARRLRPLAPSEELRQPLDPLESAIEQQKGHLEQYQAVEDMKEQYVTVMHYGEKNLENFYESITPETKELALEMGWKQFFTNRLQLQRQRR